MEEIREIIEALECMAVPRSKDKDCSKCKYRLLEQCIKHADVTIDGVGYWESCDCDQAAIDAAVILKQLKPVEGYFYNGQQLYVRNKTETIEISQVDKVAPGRQVTVIKCEVCGSFYEPCSTHICKKRGGI